MALVRWDPSRDVDTLQAEMNRLFDGFFGNDARERTRRWVPAMDLVETKDDLVLRADLPGMSEDDISLEIKDGVLNVSGERQFEHKDETEGFYRFERGFGSFSRSLSLPQGVNADSVKASFDKGVLEVRIPKPEERKPHRVAIGNGSLEGEATEK
jgi:HSP20 family protein